MAPHTIAILVHWACVKPLQGPELAGVEVVGIGIVELGTIAMAVAPFVGIGVG